MLKYFVSLVYFILLFSCSNNTSNQLTSNRAPAAINADSLLLDFKNEQDTVKKINKGLGLDSIFLQKQLYGKWAVLKIQLGDFYYDQLNDEKKSAAEFEILATANFHDDKDSLFNTAVCKAYVMHTYYLRNWHSQYFKAIEFCQKYLVNPFHKFVDDSYLASVYKYLGSSCTRIGDNASALKYLTLAYDENTRKRNYEDAAGNCIDIAVIYFGQKKYSKALSIVDSVLKFRINDKITRSNLLLSKALTLIASNNSAEAGMLVNFVLDSKDFDSEMLSDIFQVKARLFFEQKDYQGAFEFYNKAINEKVLIDSNLKLREYGKIFKEAGDCFLKEQDLETALYYYHKSLWTVTPVDSSNIFTLPSKQQLYAENTIMEALDAKAETFQLLYKQKPDLKYLQTAVQCYELSFEVERKLMQYFSYDESKLLMLQESRLRSQNAISLCYQLYQLTKNNAWAEKAFQFAEKNKAFVLLESVKRNLAANSALQNDTLYQKTQSLQLQLAYIERSIAEAENDSAKEKLTEQKTKLENDLLFAKTALARQSNAYKTVMEKEDSISANLVSASLLNEHTGLIEFFSADTATYAFVLNKNLPLQFIKYNETLSIEIDSVLSFFKTASAITNNPSGYQKAAYRLYSTLGFQQFDKAWQNLIIIPDGKLCFLPFDALITTAAANVNLQQAAYFINQCNTVYGYSAQILLEQQTNNSTASGNITVFAPVFAGSQNKQRTLLYSQEEADAVAANKNTQLFLKEKATLNNFRNQFTQTGILHIATHAYADTGINSNSKIEFIDSSLLLNELYALHTSASLVVLSACETGIGQLNKSEGSMSLARGFYYSGAKNVITSYWNVDDKSTAALFTSFYKEINASTYSDALFNAKKEFIKNATATSASPYYWAGFVHFGVPQKKEGGNYWWWLLVVPFSIIGLVILRRKV